jgi:hypothetical protein
MMAMVLSFALSLGSIYTFKTMNKKKMNRLTATPEPAALRRDRERYAALQGAIGELGFFRRGNLVEVYGRCGKKGCCCAADPPRLHGPYLQWTRKVSGKTVSVRVRPEHANLIKEWIRNSRRLDRLIAQMQKLSMRATERILRLES